MQNRVYLKDVPDTDVKTLAALPIDQLDLLVSEAEDAMKAVRDVVERLHTALAARFADRAADARRAEGKDTGTVRLIEGDYEVVANLPKRVAWDQKTLPDLLDELPSDVAKRLARVKIEIDERAFNDLPADYRAILTRARTVSTGKPGFAVKPLAEVA